MHFKYESIYKEYEQKFVQIQVLVGEELFEIIKEAAELENITRNLWIMNAIRNFLETDEMKRYPLKMSDLARNRRRIMIRVSPLELQIINEKCLDLDSNRSHYIIDAMLTALSEQEVFIDKYDDYN